MATEHPITFTVDSPVAFHIRVSKEEVFPDWPKELVNIALQMVDEVKKVHPDAEISIEVDA